MSGNTNTLEIVALNWSFIKPFKFPVKDRTLNTLIIEIFLMATLIINPDLKFGLKGKVFILSRWCLEIKNFIDLSMIGIFTKRCSRSCSGFLMQP